MTSDPAHENVAASTAPPQTTCESCGRAVESAERPVADGHLCAVCAGGAPKRSILIWVWAGLLTLMTIAGAAQLARGQAVTNRILLVVSLGCAWAACVWWAAASRRVARQPSAGRQRAGKLLFILGTMSFAALPISTARTNPDADPFFTAACAVGFGLLLAVAGGKLAFNWPKKAGPSQST